MDGIIQINQMLVSRFFMVLIRCQGTLIISDEIRPHRPLSLILASVVLRPLKKTNRIKISHYESAQGNLISNMPQKKLCCMFSANK